MNYLLDSCALLSYLLGEKEASQLKKLFKDPNHKFYLNYINYGEVIFILGKKGLSQELLQQSKESLKLYLNIQFLKTDDFEIIEKAADYKISGGLSYFDALILAVGKKYDLTIITKDMEFKKFSTDLKIHFL